MELGNIEKIIPTQPQDDLFSKFKYLKLHMHTSNLEYYDRHRIREILLVTTEYQYSFES